MAMDPTVLTTDHAEDGLTPDALEQLHAGERDVLRAEADDHLAKLTTKRDELKRNHPIEMAHLEALIKEATAARKELG